MQSFGKILGGFFGLLLAGPIGAIIGLFFGHVIDKQISNPWARWIGQQNQSQHSQAQHIFFDTTFSVMGYVAKADGHVSKNEIRVAEKVMRQMQLNATRRKEAIRCFNLGKQNDFELETQVNQLINACRHEPLLLRMFFEIQLQAAMADGMLRPENSRIMQMLAKQLGIPWIDFNAFEDMFSQQGHRGYQRQYQHQQHQSTYTSSLSDAFKTLGIPETSQHSEIKHAYRKLMKENHPDKLISKGLPPEMIKLATEKTQRIQKAYEQIRKAKGIK